jgi:hypothetical protein
MDLSSFQLYSITFEVRYDPGFLLYDKAGLFWHALRQAHPTLKLTQVAPAKVVGNIDDQYQVSLELERFAADTFNPLTPTKIESYLGLCGTWLSRATDMLELTLFSRIGLRLIYRKSYSNIGDASKELLALELLKIPTGKHFGIEGQPVGPVYSIRWEDGKLGMQVNLRTQQRKLAVEPPLGERAFERIDKEFFDFDFDLDYYTMVSVAVGQFSAKDWIQQAMRVIRRDSGVFLGG